MIDDLAYLHECPRELVAREVSEAAIRWGYPVMDAMIALLSDSIDDEPGRDDDDGQE